MEKFNPETEEYEYELLIETKETELELPLKAGKYRYTIKVYNYLNQLDFNTEWVPVEIVQTYQPVITSVFPIAIYLDEAPDGVFIVQGMNLRPETVFTIENTWYEIQAQVTQRDKYNQRVVLKVNPALLEGGNYYIRAVNPGGVFDTSGTIKVTFRKDWDGYVSVGYAPMIFPFTLDKTPKVEGGWQNADSLLEFFGTGELNGFMDMFKPFGMEARASLYPKKTSHVYYGYSIFFCADYLNYTNTINDKPTYKINAVNYNLCFDGNIMFMLKKKFPLKITADIHAGVGLSGFAFAQVSYPQINYKAKPFGSIGICGNIGGAMQFYFSEKTYLDVGFDFIDSLQEKRSLTEVNSKISHNYLIFVYNFICIIINISIIIFHYIIILLHR